WQGEGASRQGGSGLGLAIARAIARAHGGEVQVADGRPGHCSLEVQLLVRWRGCCAACPVCWRCTTCMCGR
ncbi:MAG: ATP-binding protein, partial [Cyanobium sp.]